MTFRSSLPKEKERVKTVHRRLEEFPTQFEDVTVTLKQRERQSYHLSRKMRLSQTEATMNTNGTENFCTYLLQTIEETTRYCLGDKGARLVFNYLKQKGIAKQDFTKKLDIFVKKLD
jgi:hypothetical protein